MNVNKTRRLKKSRRVKTTRKQFGGETWIKYIEEIVHRFLNFLRMSFGLEISKKVEEEVIEKVTEEISEEITENGSILQNNTNNVGTLAVEKTITVLGNLALGNLDEFEKTKPNESIDYSAELANDKDHHDSMSWESKKDSILSQQKIIEEENKKEFYKTKENIDCTLLSKKDDDYFYTHNKLYYIGNIVRAETYESVITGNPVVKFITTNPKKTVLITNVISGRMINSREVDSYGNLKDGVLTFNNDNVDYVNSRNYSNNKNHR